MAGPLAASAGTFLVGRRRQRCSRRHRAAARDERVRTPARPSRLRHPLARAGPGYGDVGAGGSSADCPVARARRGASRMRGRQCRFSSGHRALWRALGDTHRVRAPVLDFARNVGRSKAIVRYRHGAERTDHGRPLTAMAPSRRGLSGIERRVRSPRAAITLHSGRLVAGANVGRPESTGARRGVIGAVSDNGIRYGTAWSAGEGAQSLGSSVLIGTHPSRPAGERHQNQPLVRSSATTSSSSPTSVGNSVVSYAAATTTAHPEDADRCRAGTHPEPFAALTKTNSGHSVSRSPTSTRCPTASRTGDRSGI